MDFRIALSMFGSAALLCLTYVMRVLIAGRARSSRVDRDGASALLGKGPKEMVYWSLGPIGRVLVSAGVSADAVSWASLALGLGAGVLLARGSFGAAAAVSVASSLCDALDGMVARMRGKASDAGEVLDAAIDRYVEFAFIAGLVFFYRESAIGIALALLALLGSFMVSYSTAKAEALHVDPPRGNMRRSERATVLVLGSALSPFSMRWLESAPTLPMLLSLALVGVLANASATRRLASIARQVRKDQPS